MQMFILNLSLSGVSYLPKKIKMFILHHSQSGISYLPTKKSKCLFYTSPCLEFHISLQINQIVYSIPFPIWNFISPYKNVKMFILYLSLAGVSYLPTPASVAHLDAPSNWRPGGHGFNLSRGRQHSFVEIYREIFSTVILSLPLIQEGQLSLVSGERMCTILVNRLED